MKRIMGDSHQMKSFVPNRLDVTDMQEYVKGKIHTTGQDNMGRAYVQIMIGETMISYTWATYEQMYVRD
jgi:hypothetical protein